MITETEAGIIQGVIRVKISRASNGHGLLLGNISEIILNNERDPYVDPESSLSFLLTLLWTAIHKVPNPKPQTLNVGLRLGFNLSIANSQLQTSEPQHSNPEPFTPPKTSELQSKLRKGGYHVPRV